MTNGERIGSMTKHTVKPKTIFEKSYELAQMPFYRLTYVCPSCNTRFDNEKRKPKYCSECGTKFDWGNEDD